MRYLIIRIFIIFVFCSPYIIPVSSHAVTVAVVSKSFNNAVYYPDYPASNTAVLDCRYPTPFRYTNGYWYFLTSRTGCDTWEDTTFYGSGTARDDADAYAFDPTLDPNYVAPPSVPEHCSNLVRDVLDGELGVDCGGTCPGPCTKICDTGCSLNAFNDCVCYADTDPWGNCPKNCEKMPMMVDGVMTNVCSCAPGDDAGQLVPSEWIDNSDPENPVLDPALASPEVVAAAAEAPVLWGKPGVSVMTQDDPYVVVDNGDGTSTNTQTSTKQVTKTDASGKETTTNETTVTTRIINNEDGALISSSTAQESEGDPQEDLSNYDTSMLVLPAAGDFNTEIDAELMPEETDIFSVFTDFAKNLPIIKAFASVKIVTSSPVCDIPIGTYFGVYLHFDLCRYEAFLRQMGAIAVMFAQASAIFIVIKGWK